MSPSEPTVAQRPAFTRWQGVLGHPALWPALLVLALYTVLYLHFAGQLIQYPLDLDQGEGYDAWSGWLINLGQWPYTSNAAFPYYSSNYPPLWSYLVSIPLAWTGPGLAAARGVSTLAALGVAGVLGVAARRLAHSGLAAILAALLFLASPYVFHTTPLARVNGTALLFSVLALVLLETPYGWRVVGGLVALLLAVFTKQTALDAVAAGCLYVLLVRGRVGLLALTAPGAAAIAGLGGLVWLTHGAFWLNVVAANANPFDPRQLADYLVNFSAIHCVLLILAALEWWSSIRTRSWSPWTFYLPIAALVALTVGKWGAGESYFLPTLAAACVLGSAGCVRVLRVAAGSGNPRLATVALSAALLLQAVLLSHGLGDAPGWLADHGLQAAPLGQVPSAADQATANDLVRQVRGLSGPVLSEDPSLAVAGGKPVVGNATQLRNLYTAGLWDPTPLVADIRAHRFSMIVLDAELYPEPVLQAIGRSYYEARVVQVGSIRYHVMLPGAN